MNNLETPKEWIRVGKIDEAIEQLRQLLTSNHQLNKDNIYFLLGNAYRKKENWREALNNYQKAIDINPDSPAVLARKAVIDILEFYNKDMYNQ